MRTRLELHNELLQFVSKAYYQPPSDIRMQYPCVIYAKLTPHTEQANNRLYKKFNFYQLIVVEPDPDSELADRIVDHFQYASINNRAVVDRLHQTTINLYF